MSLINLAHKILSDLYDGDLQNIAKRANELLSCMIQLRSASTTSGLTIYSFMTQSSLECPISEKEIRNFILKYGNPNEFKPDSIYINYKLWYQKSDKLTTYAYYVIMTELEENHLKALLYLQFIWNQDHWELFSINIKQLKHENIMDPFLTMGCSSTLSETKEKFIKNTKDEKSGSEGENMDLDGYWDDFSSEDEMDDGLFELDKALDRKIIDIQKSQNNLTIAENESTKSNFQITESNNSKSEINRIFDPSHQLKTHLKKLIQVAYQFSSLIELDKDSFLDVVKDVIKETE